MGNRKLLSEEEKKAKRREYREKNKDKIAEYQKEYCKKYREDNKDGIKERSKEYVKENKDKIVQYKKEYYKKNKEKVDKKNKKYQEDNKKKISLYLKEYNKKNKERIRKKGRKYDASRRKDPIIRLNQNISGGIRSSLKSKGLSKKGRHWEDLVGYTSQELRDHLENLFQLGMTWRNMKEWHIDHVLPLSFFKYKSTDDVEFKYCWSLNNLQPLWAKDNIRKSNKIIRRAM